MRPFSADLRPEPQKPLYELGLQLAFMCAFANLLSHANRQILVVLVERINSDLHISDTQFGILMGPAFSVAYAISTIIIAEFTDANSKVRMISIGVFVWSAATFASAFVESFEGLLLCRALVGLGQSILSPAAYTLLASHYPKNQLGRISSLYAMGSFLGSALVLIVGGFFAEQSLQKPEFELWSNFSIARWRLIFLWVGGVGLIYSLVFVWLHKNTEHHQQYRQQPEQQNKQEQSPTPHVPYPEVVRYLWKYRDCYRFYILGFSSYSVALFCIIAWGPAFFIRQLDMNQSQAGLVLALIMGTANLSGVWASGYIMDKLRERGLKQAPYIIGTVGAGITALTAVGFYSAFSEQWHHNWVLLGFFLCAHFASYPIAPSASTNQLMTAIPMRARAYAIFLCVNNLLAMGAGLSLVGYLNDYVFSEQEAIGKSLALVVFLSACAASVLLGLGAKPYLRKLDRNAQHQGQYL
ncbi:MFS transporter [Pseudoteredinibacter isoporae]|uniref:MFS family permease n=1 Tax=Pseudoteredinibacter isoporae TaxID=570281 RepID=A0A7X0JVE5_9GAMM|nr:MFS transporter [Pseudoteredinibacter isoporae]MBB6522145.1 MFS family permease [Pseudoteredinibacter isoporae]NHO87680.1 MFS transporter [Pseudoteredinibacter isoporae]NIB23989.1 MFS transporter [Pseudoteredinibacter isoporae]